MRWLVLPAIVALTSCGSSEDIAEQRFEPETPGRLTVATALPAPGFWDGNEVGDLSGGFEYGIARQLADRFDLELDVIDVPFDRLVAGELDGADLALAQITITDEREEQVAFSVPYYTDDAGAVLAAGEELTDLETAKEQRWAVERGTVEADFLDDVVRPDDEPILFEDAVACIDAVAAGRADAALVDLSTALILTQGRSDVTTGGDRAGAQRSESSGAGRARAVGHAGQAPEQCWAPGRDGRGAIPRRGERAHRDRRRRPP